MKTALLSELIVSRGVLVQSAVIYVVVAGVIGLSMQSPIAMLACVGAMTPVMMTFTFCAMDAQNGWERFRATLPVSRAALVASRYANVLATTAVMVLLAWVLALVLGNAAVPVLPFEPADAAAFADELSDPLQLLCAGLLGAAMMLGLSALILPLSMRYGMTKSMRIVPVVLIMLLPVSMLVLKQLPDMASAFVQVGAWMEAHFLVAATAFVAAMLAAYAISCAVAIALYRTKEL